MATTITLRQGYTSRYLITATDANGSPFDSSDYTVEFLVKAMSGSTTAALRFSLDGSDGTSTPAGRMSFGRPNPADLDGALIDATATSGFITVRFAPADTATLVDTSAKTFVWEARAVGADDTYYLDAGQLTVQDSYFLPTVP